MSTPASAPGSPKSISPTAETSPTKALFIGVTYAGHKTRFHNLREHSKDDHRLDPIYREITGWKDDGLIERVPLVPRGISGRARAVIESAAFARLPRPDVIWSSAEETLTPHLWSQVWRLKRPVVLDTDWTFDLGEEFAPVYFGRPPRTGIRRAIARAQERALWRSVALFLPWSNWAAADMRRQGIAPERIRVLPPGLDLDIWKPRPELRGEHSGKLRLLFVGGDFRRKGGDILLEVFRAQFGDDCEIDVVTRDAVDETPGVRVHRTEANSELLRELYAGADLFVLPTQAEAFGIATTEAMASGLPVIVTDIGGARDIVDPGETGWLIAANAESLAAALRQAVEHKERLGAMGRRARAVAEKRFDGKRNDALIVDHMLEEAQKYQARRKRTP